MAECKDTPPLTMTAYLTAVIICVLQLKEKRVYDVKSIVHNITKGAKNELEKLRAIWVWLCHNIGACLPCTYRELQHILNQSYDGF